MSEPGQITARTALAFLLATWPRRIHLSLVLLVPVVVAAAGGFRTAEAAALRAEPGTPTDTGAYQVVPRSYFVSDRVDAGSLEDGQRWVGALVQITNQGTEPISVTFSDQTFQLSDDVPTEEGANPYPYEVLRLDTGSRLGWAQPGLTYEVALVWRTTGLEEPPPELGLTLNQTVWRQWNIEAGFASWGTTGDSFEVLLPLGEAPESVLEEDE